MITLQSYRNNKNIGDAIQAISISRLINQPFEWKFRNEYKGSDLHICCGWLGDDWNPNESYEYETREPDSYSNIIMSGVFFNGEESIKHTPYLNIIIGARDPYTYNRLKDRGIPTQLIGCATLTLPRYYGPRKGTLFIDVPPNVHNSINDPMPHSVGTNTYNLATWSQELVIANSLIWRLATCELVVTNRLHVLYPCLALGTPVICYFDENDPRFSFVTEILHIKSGVKVNPESDFTQPHESVVRLMKHKIHTWSNKYINFLNDRLKEKQS